MRRDHPHGIPREPALPDLGDETTRRCLEDEVDGAVLVGRVARGHAPRVQEDVIGVFRERRPRAEVLPEAFVRPVVLVPESTRGLADLPEIAGLEERVPGMSGETAEKIGTEHRCDHRPVAAAGLSGDATVLRHREGAVVGVHPRDDFVAEVGVVAAGARRVEELASAE
jgi:hypothetical protein